MPLLPMDPLVYAERDHLVTRVDKLEAENKRLKDRVDNALMHLGMLYRGEWATNDERDSIIDAAWDALRD